MGLYLSISVFFILVVLLPDIFLFFKLRKHQVNIFLYVLNFLPSGYFLFLISYLSIINRTGVIFEKMHLAIWLNFIFILMHLPKLVYLIFHFINYLINLFLKEKIKLIRYAGIITAMFIVVILLHGTFINPVNIETKEINLEVDNLPDEFEGFKIVQISDIHLGSWGKQTKYLETAIYVVNAQEANILVFTGDMVNNCYTEMQGWENLFHKFKSKNGKYAVLGNHDYGDYVKWESESKKQENIHLIKKGIQDFGFQLLCNESVKIFKDSSYIELIGVENWGKPPFPQYGDLELAIQNTDSSSLKILLSHDPSHWKSEVLDKKDIFLTLSGHTHAGQMSFNMYGKRRSPSAWLYNEWNGLYQSNNQYLYVNRGLGYIGAPIRLGAARPEVTSIILHKK